MHGMVPPDPLTKVSQAHYAIVSVSRRSRKRFSAGCVEIKETQEEALAAEDIVNKIYAAIVIGPSKSSEGQYLYYLSEWIGNF
jgi:4-hydroxy-3-methylbut-2-enyl diphosphate reductase IspH